MTLEQRIRFLLRIATRAEGEGDQRAASAYRRMAAEARPVERSSFVAPPPPLGVLLD